MTKPDPKFSEGARYERRTVLARIRRQLRVIPEDQPFGRAAFASLEQYMVTRQRRYDRTAGGLGTARR